MDHLPPAPLVAGVREPPAPVPHRALEELGGLCAAERRRQGPRVGLLERERRAVAGADGELCDDTEPSSLERRLGRERQREAGGAEQDAVLHELDLVLFAAVVEARHAFHLQAHLAADGHHAPDQPATLVRVAVDRHEVLDLDDSVGRHEARDQDVRVGKVELLGHTLGHDRCDPVVAALARVEDRGEDAGRIEPRQAVPVDRAVRTDERDGVQVADHAVLGDGQVVGHGIVRGGDATLQHAVSPSRSRACGALC